MYLRADFRGRDWEELAIKAGKTSSCHSPFELDSAG